MNLSHVVPLQFTLFTCKELFAPTGRWFTDVWIWAAFPPIFPPLSAVTSWLKLTFRSVGWPSNQQRPDKGGKDGKGVWWGVYILHLSISFNTGYLSSPVVVVHFVPSCIQIGSNQSLRMHVLKSDTEPSWKSKVNSRHMTFWPNNRCNQVNPWQDAPSFSIARISWTNSSEPYVDCTSSGSRISSSWSFRREFGWVSKNRVIKPLARLWFLLFILVLEYVSLYWNSLQYRFFIREIYWCDDMSIRLCDEIFWAIPTMPHSMHVHSSIVFAALCGTARNHQQILPCRYSAWWSRDERVQ